MNRLNISHGFIYFYSQKNSRKNKTERKKI